VSGEVALDAYVSGGFPTPTGRLETYSEQLSEIGQDPEPKLPFDRLPSPQDAEFPLRLGCAKSVAFCHSQHRNILSLRRLSQDPPLEI
jgi:anaerobic selenocysteine-containing dehydrogenase